MGVRLPDGHSPRNAAEELLALGVDGIAPCRWRDFIREARRTVGALPSARDRALVLEGISTLERWRREVEGCRSGRIRILGSPLIGAGE